MTEKTDTSSPTATTCRTCGSDLSLPWPDLDAILKSQVLEDAGPEAVSRGRESGCPFCGLVTSVFDDACAKFGVVEGEGFIVNLHEKDGHHVLVLGYCTMMHEDPGFRGMDVGSIVVYADGPSTMSCTLEPHKSIAPRASSPQALELAKRWLSECELNHPECRPIPSANGLYYVPGRLLDISSPSTARLIEPDATSKASVPPRYVALSHCWGGVQPLKTCLSNMDQHLSSIAIDTMPQTFQDAIAMSRSLGFERIWIDSLCIIQDSREDWELHSAQMADVYGNAALVLATAAAASAVDGFLGERHPYREASVVVAPGPPGREAQATLKYRLVHPHFPIHPLERRGWTLQERLMAKRYLAYGRYEMAWDCLASSACECGWDAFSRGFNVYDLANIGKRIGATPRRADLPRLWRDNVLGPYSIRALSVASDKLVALSAMAAVFQAGLLGDDGDGDSESGAYLAGLWRADLVRELLWMGNGRGTAEAFYAPSWSWASVKGMWGAYTSRNEEGDGPRGEGAEFEAEIVEARCTPATANPFGPVSEGVITIRGAAMQVTVRIAETDEEADDGAVERVSAPVTGVVRLAEKDSEDGPEVEGWTYPDTLLADTVVTLGDGTRELSTRRLRHGEDRLAPDADAGPATFHAWLLPLLWNKGSAELRGLLLGRSPTKPEHYERLGGCGFPAGPRWKEFLGRRPTREVVIV